MRSLIVTLIFISTIACTTCSPHKEGCSCSGLETGSNPCRCDEIVVKAAKQSKPLRYVSPEAIAEAAVTREIIAKFSAKPMKTRPCGQAASGINYVETAAITENPGLYEIIHKGALVNPSVIDSALIVSGTEASGGCGCDTDVSKIQLGIKDLLNPNPNARIVPKFLPIGDMCHSSSSNSQSSNQQPGSAIVTKVTPAYPGKIKCSCNSSNKEESIDCMSVLRSLMNGRGLAKFTDGTTPKGATGNQDYRFEPGSATVGFSETIRGFGSVNSPDAFSETIAASRISGKSAEVPFGNTGRVFLVAKELDTPGFDVVSDNAAVVEVTETLEQQTIPQTPADPVSLSLAYKYLIPQQKKFVVSEDKLSFGPTAVPKEAVKEAPVLQVDEEKLVTIEKPVMLLQVSAANEKSTLKTSSEEEEERLAELDALERMRLEKESKIDCSPTPQPYLTYRELGYAPVIKQYMNSPMATMINVVTNVEESSSSGSALAEEPCGPMGPLKPDYIPGNVYVNQPTIETEIVEDTVYQNERDDERSIESTDDDDDEETSAVNDSRPGFLARLSSSSHNYGATACPF